MVIKAIVIAALALPVCAWVAHAEMIDPAQAIAQKFSEADEPKAQPKPVAPSAAPKAAPAAERPNLDYEMDMLRRARAEEMEREQAEAPQAPAKSQDMVPAAPPGPPVSPPQVVPPASANLPTPAPASAPAVHSIDVRAPAEVAPPLRTTAAAPAPNTPPLPVAPPEQRAVAVPSPIPPAAPPSPVATPGQTATAADGHERPLAVVAPEGVQGSSSGPGLSDIPDTMFGKMPRATVLLVLEADGSTARTRPDPIICLEDRCWLSNGYEAPARPVLRSQAVAMQSSAKASNDSCNGKSACVYRNIAFRPETQIQVVELGEGHGTSDGAYTVDADLSCRKVDEALVCDNGLSTHEFKLWMVPEATAQALGPHRLEDAIVSGLQSSGGYSGVDK